jgi:phosphoribosylaminoimidazole carboxylase
MSELSNFVDKAITVPGASVHLYGKTECRKGRKMGHLTIVGNSDAQINDRLRPLLSLLPNPMSQEEITRYVPEVAGTGFSHPKPLVGVIMGSDSDLPVMLPAARILDRFGIPYELTIVSAHRTPDRLVQYARSAASRGLRTIIAGAGGAAHLPGMVAAMTALPVIGVPVKGSSLDGVDSLHSIVQMPVRCCIICVIYTHPFLAWYSCCHRCYQRRHECRSFGCPHSIRGYARVSSDHGGLPAGAGNRSIG